MLSVTELLAAGAVVISLYTAVTSRQRDVLTKELNIGGRLVAVETNMAFMLRTLDRMEDRALRNLHAPTHFDRDRLIERYREGRATDEDIDALIDQLTDVYNDPTAPNEWRQSAILALATLESRREAKQQGASQYDNSNRNVGLIRRILNRVRKVIDNPANL